MEFKTSVRLPDAMAKGTSAPASARWYEPMTLREIILAWLSLAAVGGLAFAPHILEGGFYLDDWADAAATLHPAGGAGFGEALSYFNELLASCRPVLILFFPLKYIVFGTHIKLLLAFSVALAVAVAALLYAVLRKLNFAWYHSWAVAALSIVYPWFDSTRFWESANPVSLALVFALAGLWVALIGLDRRSWKLHLVAAILYLLSMLSYETTLPVIAAAGLLYVMRAGWSAGGWRWGLDLAMVLAAGLWARIHTPRAVSDLSGNIEHLGDIVTQGGDILAWTLWPLGLHPQFGIVLAVLISLWLTGLAFDRLAPEPARSSWSLRSWLLLGLSGLAAAALGWVMFIPADPYYTPSIFGFTNRVNGVAGLGLIVAIYSALGIAGSLAARLLKRPRTATVVTLALAAALGAGYVSVLERHSQIWADAYDRELAVVGGIKEAFPRLSPGTTVFASGFSAYQTLGVPVFSTSWDLNGMVRLIYEDGTLRGYPITEELEPLCKRHGIGVDGQGETIPIVAYRTARFVNVETGETLAPRNRRECMKQIVRFPPGPLYLSTAY